MTNILDLINAKRAAHGVPALTSNPRIEAAALEHAQDMAAHVGLVHIGSDGSDGGERMHRAGYQWYQWGEVVGWGWDGDAARMVDWWMQSLEHRPYLLDGRFTDIGVGYVYAPGSQWRHYWTVDFGRTNAPAPPPPEPPKPPTAPPFSSYVPIVTGGPKTAQIGLLDYLRGDGRAYMVQHPSGGSEKFRTVRDGARFLQLKNSQWEEFWFTDDFIWRGKDTSPGDGQYYRQFEDGQAGARWCPRWMAVGQAWESPAEHTVQTYWKSNCQPVDHHRNGRTRNRLTLRARHAAMTWNGVTVEDVIEVGSHTGESMFFGRGYGLVAWSSTWGSSAIAHLLPANEADNTPEGGCFG